MCGDLIKKEVAGMFDEIGDKELMSLIKRGDKDAFNELYSRYGRFVFNVAYKLTGTIVEAEEVTQEVFEKIWTKRNTYMLDKKVTTWMIQICKNTAIDKLRRKKRLSPIDEYQLDFIVDETINLDDEVEINTIREKLMEAISNLPEKQREIIRLIYFEGMTQREIAASLEIPLGTVKSRLKLAMSKLKNHFKR